LTGDAMDLPSETETTETTGPAPTSTMPTIPDSADGDLVPATALDELRRRTNVLVGVLAALLAGAFVLIVVLFGRLDEQADDPGDLQPVVPDQAQDAATRAELDELRAEIERVEAGAALYASQLQGYQELFAEAGPEISAGV